MNLNDSFVIACCLEDNEYSKKFKGFLKPYEELAPPFRNIIRYLQSTETTCFVELYQRFGKETIYEAMRLTNWAAQHKFNMKYNR
jgi:hypothetical protein